METLCRVRPCSGYVSEEMRLQREHNTRISRGKASTDGARGRKDWLISGQSEKDSMGKTGVLVVLQFSGGVWKHGLSATWVARLFLASPPLYCHWLFALVSIVAHFLRTNVDFALYGESGDLWNRCGLQRVRARVAADVQIPLTCLLFSFILRRPYSARPQRHCSRSWNPVCRVNRGAENNTRKRENFHPAFCSPFSPP